MKMATKLTFNKMQVVAKKVFGMEIKRSGNRFHLQKGDIWLGEGNGNLFSLRDIRDLFQQWLDHPEIVDLLSPELQEALGQDISKNQQARTSAANIGVTLVREKGGFLMLKDGERLGYDFDELWTADDVIDCCAIIGKGDRAGVYMVG